jgi:hypothetical protein
MRKQAQRRTFNSPDAEGHIAARDRILHGTKPPQKRTETCERCGDEKPIGQSCMCFDNNCQ